MQMQLMRLATLVILHLNGNDMRYLSTFSGIGGFEIPAAELGHECIGFSEIDKYAKQIYLKHFPHHHDYGDITKISETELPQFDILIGGFPCQSFSMAGKRRGFADTRGTMFFELCRIAKEKRPKFLVFENVKGLLNHARGQTFATILSALDELGYDAQWHVCNSRYFGVPQHRERVYIVCHSRTEPRPQVFPIGEDEGLYPEPQTDQQGVHEIARTITTKSGSNATGSYIASTLTARQYANWNGNFVKVGTLRTQKDGRGFREMKGEGNVTPTLQARARQDGSGQVVIETQDDIRRLTPLECERAQGFPDHWTEGVSDTQRYKMLGNAVTVNVARSILTCLPHA